MNIKFDTFTDRVATPRHATLQMSQAVGAECQQGARVSVPSLLASSHHNGGLQRYIEIVVPNAYWSRSSSPVGTSQSTGNARP